MSFIRLEIEFDNSESPVLTHREIKDRAVEIAAIAEIMFEAPVKKCAAGEFP